MGIILVPAFLLMLIGFSYVGIRAGGQAISRAQGSLTAVLVLVAMSIALIVAAIVLPFTVVASSRVSAAGFVLCAMIGVAGVAGFAGAYFQEQCRNTDKPVYGLTAAAFYLSAASFPVTWLWLAERMAAWFLVKWNY